MDIAGLIKTLGLTRPLLAFDLETTDSFDGNRMVQLGAQKLFPDGRIEKTNQLVNPGVPISPETTEVHGITDEMVKDCPKFGEMLDEMKDLFGDADLAGYNSARFDYEVICLEFQRQGIKFPFLDDLKQYDALRVFQEHSPRKLANAYEFYTGKNLENAHDAMADIDATLEIMFSQMLREQIDPGEPGSTLESVSKFVKGDNVDWAGKLKYDKRTGQIVYNIGKVKGTPVSSDPGFGNWMLKQDFPEETKDILRRLLGHEN